MPRRSRAAADGLTFELLKNSTADNPLPQPVSARFPFKDAACLLIVIGIGALALWPYLFTRQTLYWGDIELYFAPMQSFLHESLRRGIVPLWNPYILCGEPFVGNPQTWPLYPSTLLAGSMSAWRFLTVTDALHLLLGGAFFYGFLRGEGLCRRAGGVLGAVCFMLGGYFVTKCQFPNMAQAIAWVPAVLWTTGRLARVPSFWTALWLGICLGLQLLAAHAQITLLTGYLALAYALYNAWPRLVGKDRASADWARLIGWGVAALSLACCLDGGELLPVLEVWKHSDRQILTLATANRFVLRPSHIVGLIAPNVFGSPFNGDFHGGGNYWEPACYLGIAPCLLALAEIAAGWRPRAKATLFWTGVLLASLWLATGRSGGLYVLAFHLLPSVRAFHDPARTLLGAAVAGALLAGRGLDRLLLVSPSKWTWQARFAVAVGAVLLTAFDLAHFDRRAYPLISTATIKAAIQEAHSESVGQMNAGERVVYPPDNKATWKYFADYGDYRWRDPSYMKSLFATHTTDTGMLLGISDAGGYEPEPPLGAVRRYIDAYNDHTQGRGNAGLDALNVGALISFAPGATPGVPRGYFASHSIEQWLNPEQKRVTRARLSDGRYLSVVDLSPDKVAAAVPANAGGETLRMADTDAPGWSAQWVGTDGTISLLDMTRTRNGLRLVALPRRTEGAGKVVMCYAPDAWRVGLFLTLLAAGFATGCAVFAVSSRSRAFKEF